MNDNAHLAWKRGGATLVVLFLTYLVASASDWHSLGLLRLKSVKAHQGVVCGLHFCREQALLISTATSGQVKAFKVDGSGFHEVTRRDSDFGIQLTRTRRTGASLYLLRDDGRIHRCAVRTSSDPQISITDDVVPIVTKAIRDFCVSDDDSLIAIVVEDSLAVHDTKSGQLIWRKKTGYELPGGFVVFDPTTKLLLMTPFATQRIWILDALSGTDVGDFTCTDDFSIGFAWGAFSPDGKTLATGTRSRKVRFWDWERRKLVSECHIYDDARSWSCYRFNDDSSAVLTAKSTSNIAAPSEITLVKRDGPTILRLAQSSRPLALETSANCASAVCFGENSDVIYFGTTDGRLFQLK